MFVLKQDKNVPDFINNIINTQRELTTLDRFSCIARDTTEARIASGNCCVAYE